jgi:hypothetical protein
MGLNRFFGLFAPADGTLAARSRETTARPTGSYRERLSRLHQLDAIFMIFGASDRDKRLILQGRGLRKPL